MMDESPKGLTLSLEERKLVLEEQRVQIEVEKLKVERLKAWTTGGSIVISLLIASLTIGFGVWSQRQQGITQLNLQNKQSKSQIDLAEKTAKSQFEIKAAEIVMNANTPVGTHNKAKALLALFPNELPTNFADSFDSKNFAYSPPETVRRGKLQPRITAAPPSKTASPSPAPYRGGPGYRPKKPN